jgi:hypothetical protein
MWCSGSIRGLGPRGGGSTPPIRTRAMRRCGLLRMSIEWFRVRVPVGSRCCCEPVAQVAEHLPTPVGSRPHPSVAAVADRAPQRPRGTMRRVSMSGHAPDSCSLALERPAIQRLSVTQRKSAALRRLMPQVRILPGTRTGDATARGVLPAPRARRTTVRPHCRCAGWRQRLGALHRT